VLGAAAPIEGSGSAVESWIAERQGGGLRGGAGRRAGSRAVGPWAVEVTVDKLGCGSAVELD
jgi:hypothetical protein